MKVLYVRNLKAEVTEDQLKEEFASFGKIERVKKIKDYGFIHFEERDDAVKAMDELNGKVTYFFPGTFLYKFNYVSWFNIEVLTNICLQVVAGVPMEISLAKPPSENRQKEKRKREQQARMMRG